MAVKPTNAKRADKDKSKAVVPAKPESPAQILKRQQAAEWQQATSKAMKQNQRYPVKLEKSVTTENSMMPATIDGTRLACELYQTTGFNDMDGAALLFQQLLNANQASAQESKANGLMAFVEGIAPQSPLEGLLAGQMATAHNMAMEFSRRATVEGQSVEAVDRNINRATKLMRTFTAQIEALQKLRNKGQQKITVQHVQVGHGGQAIIGDVSQGGGM